MEEYLNKESIETNTSDLIESNINEQKTPRRVTIEYETTGKFKDISEKIPKDV